MLLKNDNRTMWKREVSPKMRILILSQWYPPEPQKLLSDLAQTLQSMGHEVEVLTGFPNYPSGTVYPGYRVRLFQRENLDGVKVVRVALYPNHDPSPIKRTLNYGSFALSSAVLGPMLMKRPDAIFVFSTPYLVGISAWVMSRIWRVPFVFNVQDMWPETLEVTGMVRSRLVLRLVGFFARWVYHKASRVIAQSDGFRRNLIDKGIPAGKIDVVPNWIDIHHYRPVEKDPELREKHGITGDFVLLFAGGTGRAQGLDSLIEAAHLLRGVAGLQIVIAGNGVEMPKLKRLCEQKKVSNVLFLGQYPEKDMPTLMGQADALLVHLRDEPLFHITVPHKIYGYMACGKPVLAAMDGDTRRVILEAEAGVSCRPGDPASLADVTKRLIAMPEKEREAMGRNGRRVAEAQYSREVLVARIAGIMEKAARRGENDHPVHQEQARA